MGISDYLRERADCIEAQAVYAHEREYAAGLRDAADIWDESQGMDPVRKILAKVRKHQVSDYRHGLLKGADLVAGSDEAANVVIRLERVEAAVEGVRVELRGLQMLLSRSLDLRDRTLE